MRERGSTTLDSSGRPPVCASSSRNLPSSARNLPPRYPTPLPTTPGRTFLNTTDAWRKGEKKIKNRRTFLLVIVFRILSLCLSLNTHTHRHIHAHTHRYSEEGSVRVIIHHTRPVRRIRISQKQLHGQHLPRYPRKAAYTSS